MQRIAKRLLALLLALLISASALTMTALAEDWRSQLRNAFGLEEDTESEPTPSPTPKAKSSKKNKNKSKATATPKPESAEDWSLPITEPQRIVNYLAKFGRLPDNFITKSEARKLGWDSSYNYVGDVAPGKSIGGDRFGNYEGQLPSKKGRTWYECDTGYKGKKRGATRLLYSSDGLYYYTDDHYNTFTQMYPEE